MARGSATGPNRRFSRTTPRVDPVGLPCVVRAGPGEDDRPRTGGERRSTLSPTTAIRSCWLEEALKPAVLKKVNSQEMERAASTSTWRRRTVHSRSAAWRASNAKLTSRACWGCEVDIGQGGEEAVGFDQKVAPRGRGHQYDPRDERRRRRKRLVRIRLWSVGAFEGSPKSDLQDVRASPRKKRPTSWQKSTPTFTATPKPNGGDCASGGAGSRNRRPTTRNLPETLETHL